MIVYLLEKIATMLVVLLAPKDAFNPQSPYGDDCREEDPEQKNDADYFLSRLEALEMKMDRRFERVKQHHVALNGKIHRVISTFGKRLFDLEQKVKMFEDKQPPIESVQEIASHVLPKVENLTETSVVVEEKPFSVNDENKVLHGEKFYHAVDNCPSCLREYTVEKDFPDLATGEDYFKIECDCGAVLTVDVLAVGDGKKFLNIMNFVSDEMKKKAQDVQTSAKNPYHDYIEND